jgi:hypothetical protein
MATNTATVKFNIGGLRYEVSRSLLEMHSESMLTKIASDQWQEDPESEIFIERDGSTFRYVLKYLRDGKVKLPITETKSDLIEELVYYNIDHDAAKIDDSNEHQANLVTTAQVAINDLQSGSIAFRCNEIALHCLDMYMHERILSVASDGTKRNIFQDDKLHLQLHTASPHGGAACFEHVDQLYRMGGTYATIQKEASIHLNKVGLALYVSATNRKGCQFTCSITKLNLKKG